jgi:hypothetical protein
MADPGLRRMLVKPRFVVVGEGLVVLMDARSEGCLAALLQSQ